MGVPCSAIVYMLVKRKKVMYVNRILSNQCSKILALIGRPSCLSTAPIPAEKAVILQRSLFILTTLGVIFAGFITTTTAGVSEHKPIRPLLCRQKPRLAGQTAPSLGLQGPVLAPGGSSVGRNGSQLFLAGLGLKATLVCWVSDGLA